MADKSCENCGYEGCPVDKGTTTCCDNWTPITPPTPDEAVEVVIECPDKNENCDKYRCDKCTARIRWDDGGVVKLKLNPNNSPKLVAWADERNMGKINIPELPKLLHDWYLEAVSKLNPTSFNPNANKAFDDLTPDQKYIDFYIAGKIIDKLKPPQKGQKWMCMLSEKDKIDL